MFRICFDFTNHHLNFEYIKTLFTICQIPFSNWSDASAAMKFVKKTVEEIFK